MLLILRLSKAGQCTAKQEKPVDSELVLWLAIPHRDSREHIPLVLLCLWVDSHRPGHTKYQQKHDDVGGVHAARLDGQKTLARSPDGAGTLPQHPGVAISDREVPPVRTRPEAATAICIETKKQSYTDRQGTKVRVRFTTAEKLNLDTPP